MMPSRLTSPTVGLIPTTPLALAGLRIEPDVSVPTASAARFALTTMPDPELDPPVCQHRPAIASGQHRGSYGLNPYSPRLL